MKAGEATVTQLFESKHVYEVPRYQRQYVWERDTQWLPLWRDVEQVTDRLIALQPGNSNANRSLQQIVPHFMGAVVVKQKSIDNSTANNLPTWIIVDGQQRLTTILLMMTAIAKRVQMVWAGHSRRIVKGIGRQPPLRGGATDRHHETSTCRFGVCVLFYSNRT